MQLLELWERGARCGMDERALHVLGVALPDCDVDTLARLDLGLRDWHLLRLRHAWFGPLMSAHGMCPHCGGEIEVELDARSLQDAEPPAQAPLHVDAEGRRYRLPNSRDLIAVVGMVDVDAAADALFAACCLDGAEASVPARTGVEEGLSALACERGIVLDLCCEACGESWNWRFDPAAFVWEEIDDRAHALLDEVHLLAAAYGWTEPDVLALGPARRSAYLERVL